MNSQAYTNKQFIVFRPSSQVPSPQSSWVIIDYKEKNGTDPEHLQFQLNQAHILLIFNE